jgi:hypothetical protein
MNLGQPQFNQQALEEEGFDISKEFILDNKETVVDFFGDNRRWYDKLHTSTLVYSKVNLDYKGELNEDPKGGGATEIAPVDPLKISDGRAENISKFFQEWKEAKRDFIEYYKHEKREKGVM